MIVGDNTSAVVEAVHQKVGIPWAVYGITVLGMSSRDEVGLKVRIPTETQIRAAITSVFTGEQTLLEQSA